MSPPNPIYFKYSVLQVVYAPLLFLIHINQLLALIHIEKINKNYII